MRHVHAPILASLLLALVTPGWLSAQEEIWSWEGVDGVFFGVAVDDAGDVDRDGYDDVIVGDYQFSGGSGKATVFSGRTGETLHAWVGKPGLNGLGRQVVGLGDVDGDRLGDVVASAFWAREDPGIYVGAVYAYSGATGELLWSQTGEADQDYFGRAMAGLGDVNGDGISDLAVAADYHDGPAGEDSGKVYVLDGTSGDVLWSQTGEAAEDHFGEGLGAAGDVDGDRRADVVVGTPRHGRDDAGKVYVYSGARGAFLISADGEAAGDWFGFAVTGLGDLNQDGAGDLLVGAPFLDGPAGERSGRIYLLSAATGRTWWTADGAAEGSILGRDVAAAGDVNDDGIADFLVGTSEGVASQTPGAAILYSGRSGRRLWSWSGDQVGDQYGLAVAGGGDVNGDGRPDQVVGAYQHRGSRGNGRVQVLAGNDLYLEASRHRVSEGDELALTTREGHVYYPTFLAVVALNGRPTWMPVGSVVLFDWTLERVVAGTVPAGLSGLELTFQSWALGWSGDLVASSREEVLFR